MAPQTVAEKDTNACPTQHPMIADDAVLVDNKIYSWKKLAANHPGGQLFVKAFAGRDATEAFMSYHRRLFPHDNHQYALLDTAQNPMNENYTDDYLELCALVDKVLPKHKSFAPTSYFIKIFTLLTIAISLEVYIHLTASYYWYYCGFLGLLFALIGLNIQHDANHGAISRNSTVNRALGMSQNWIGGSAISWIHQHVVQHHIYCNDLHSDPDVMGGFLIRINPLKQVLSHHSFQYIYVFIMIALFGFSVTIGSLNDMIKGKNFMPMSRALLRDHKWFEICTSMGFFFRWVSLPILSTLVRDGNILSTLGNIAPMFMVAGYYLAFFFLISHNFEGVHVFDSSKRPPSSSSSSSSTNSNSPNRFLYRQVVSSSNVGGAWLCFMNGGLNYQIEHHLFPRVSHCYYPMIAPIVQKYCESHHIPYVHFPTISDNVYACARHLYKMGNPNSKVMNAVIIE